MAEILHFEILRKHGQTNKHTHKHTNKQTNRHGHYNTSPSPYGGEVIKVKKLVKNKFILNNNVINVCGSVDHLGHIIDDSEYDRKVIDKAISDLYTRTNYIS